LRGPPQDIERFIGLTASMRHQHAFRLLYDRKGFEAGLQAGEGRIMRGLSVGTPGGGFLASRNQSRAGLRQASQVGLDQEASGLDSLVEITRVDAATAHESDTTTGRLIKGFATEPGRPHLPLTSQPASR
jgi:hypothetical protein